MTEQAKKPATPIIEGEIVRSKTDASLDESPLSEAASAGKPKEEIISPEGSPGEERISIVKPEDFSLEGFRSTKPANLSNVATLQAGLPHHNMAAAKDFVRLHAHRFVHGCVRAGRIPPARTYDPVVARRFWLETSVRHWRRCVDCRL
jgi:hypothetical protein